MSSKALKSPQNGAEDLAPLPNKNRPPQSKRRPDGTCEGPGCGKHVPGGTVGVRVMRYFCSEECQRKEYAFRLSQQIVGTCKQCSAGITGKKQRGRKRQFCSRECVIKFQSERALNPAGPFRPLIEEYLSVTTNYKKQTLVGVKIALCSLFGYAYTVEKLERLEEITPRVISRFLAAEKARGIKYVGVSHISTFFNWLYDEERFMERNPVIQRIHVPELRRKRHPYEDRQMSFLWGILEPSDITQLKLMFAIGEESGLRQSEVTNIRLPDINIDSQTIFVRLPTKNGETRTVPFHNKVKKYLEQWLLERDPRCEHDHLFHTNRLTPAKWCLDEWFKKFFGKHPDPAASFEFHRLRHTWATRLVNADMELPVLQQLGGWKSLESVQIYATIRKSTIDRQYEAAYTAIEAAMHAPEEECLSLLDFAIMDEAKPTSDTDPAT